MISFKKRISIGLWIVIVASALAYMTLSMMTSFRWNTVMSFICIFNALMGLLGLMVLDMKKKVVA
jgi:hypothetical protein